jgi:HTH-type transcriptional regulator/antitoxin HigA
LKNNILSFYGKTVLTAIFPAFNVLPMPEVGTSPGEVIRAELEKRGWTQTDLAAILGKHLPAVSEILQGKRSITPEMAVALAGALGRTPGFWASLDATHRVSLLGPNTEVERRAKLFSYAPVKDMEKRGWLRPTESIADLEKEILGFFNIASLDEKPKVHVNARKPFETEALDASQVAWCIRGGRLAAALNAKSFKHDVLEAAFPELRKMAYYAEKAKHLPKFLADVGIRLVIIEPLAQSPIDGAAFWLADDAPVILLSLRFDRIDALWFTLAHELSHIRHHDAQSVDSDLVGESTASDLEAIEARANKEASDFLIPHDKMKSFIIRVKPFYSKERIIQFAHRMKIHPGIVTGQLQFHRQIGWYANREMLAKVRSNITQTALTDGYGLSMPAI